MRQTKTNLADFILGDYHLNEETLFKMVKDMDEIPDHDPAMKARLKAAFAKFRQKNDQVIQGKPILPDSLYRAYYPK